MGDEITMGELEIQLLGLVTRLRTLALEMEDFSKQLDGIDCELGQLAGKANELVLNKTADESKGGE